MAKKDTKKASPADAPRRHERHSAKGKVKCTLGDVLDLSAGGMRVACTGKPALKEGNAASIKLRTSAGLEPVNARCCWVRRAGLFKGFQIGLKFIGITEEQAQRIGKIAKYGFLPEDEKPEAPKTKSKTDEGDTEEPEAKVTAELDLAPYFAVLEIEEGSTSAQIRDAHRKLVRTCHPDVCDKPESHQRFVELQHAYDMLRAYVRDTSKGDNAKAA